MITPTIYTLTYNEAYMLPYFVAHYRRMFPGCRIVVFDNESNDGTRALALSLHCEVRTNATRGKLDDSRYLQIKNNCWKPDYTPPPFNGEGWEGVEALPGWAIVVDCDEFLDITAGQLAEEEARGTTHIRGEGFNMVNVLSMSFSSIRHGLRAPSYDKVVCFNTRHVAEVNYGAGCHADNLIPTNGTPLSGASYRLRHYKYIDVNYMVQRHAMFARRLSAINLKNGWGCHYQYTEAEIRHEFNQAKKWAQIIF